MRKVARVRLTNGIEVNAYIPDKDGSHLAIFIGDYFTRSNKRGGAWMSSFKGQSNLDV